jgi:hypothetical protein
MHFWLPKRRCGTTANCRRLTATRRIFSVPCGRVDRSEQWSFSMSGHLPHALRLAHERLVTTLDAAIAQCQTRAVYASGSEVCDRIVSFVDALYTIAECPRGTPQAGLRPILMTMLSVIAGLIPLALNDGQPTAPLPTPARAIGNRLFAMLFCRY